MTPGSAGYADFTRVNDWDGPLTGPGTVTVNFRADYGPYFMGRFARFIASIAPSPTNLTFVQFDWYADNAKTVHLATETVVTHPGIPVNWEGVLDNYGPWVTVTISTIGGSGVEVTVNMVPTNRQPQRPMALPRPSMYNATQTVPAGGSAGPFYPLNYSSGPALLYATSAGSVGVQLNTWPPDSPWSEYTFYEFDVGTGAPVVAANLVLPQAGWLLRASNAGGVNADLTVVITPSPTGAAGG